jgi:hypothetical protein
MEPIAVDRSVLRGSLSHSHRAHHEGGDVIAHARLPFTMSLRCPLGLCRRGRALVLFALALGLVLLRLVMLVTRLVPALFPRLPATAAIAVCGRPMRMRSFPALALRPRALAAS